MATVTSLGFSIFSRYDGTGVNRARRDLKSFAAQNTLLTQQGSRMARTMGSLGPIAIPVFAGISKAAAGAAVSTGSAAIGIGLYALAVRNVMKDSKAGEAQVKRLKSAFDSFGTGSKGMILQTVTLGVTAAIRAMKALEPVVAAVAPIIRQIAQELANFAGSPAMTKFGQWLAAEAPAAIYTLWTAFKNLSSGLLTLGQRLGLFEGSGFNTWLLNVTTSFKAWAESPAVNKLKQFLDAAAPAVALLSGNLFKLAIAVITALAPMGLVIVQALGPMLGFITRMIEKYPILIQLVYGFYMANKVLGFIMAMLNSRIIMVTIAVARWVTVHILARAATLLWAAACGAANLATALFSATLWRTVAAHVASGTAAAANAAKTAAVRVAVFAAAAAHALLSGALWRGAAAAVAHAVATTAGRVAAMAMRGVLMAWAAAQWLLNAAMYANPFVIIVVLIVALIAAIVLAYMKCETFRNIVNAVFRAVGAAALWMWNNAIKPAFSFIGTVIMWLWNNVVKPVFGFIVGYWRMLATVAWWLWTNAIKPAFSAIGSIFGWIWNNIIKPIFGFIAAAFRVVAAVAWWLWTNAIKPAFNAIAGIVRGVWGVIKTGFTIIGNIIRFVANLIVAVWNWCWGRVRAIFNFVWGLIRGTFNTIKGWIGAAWDWVANKLAGAWNWAWGRVRAIFNFVWGLIRGTFNTIRGWIGAAWDWVANKLAGAWNWAWGRVRAIFNFVWGLIRGTFNTIRGWIGAAWDWVANKLAGAWNWAWGRVRAIFNWVWGLIRGTFNTIRGWIAAAWDWVANKLANAWNWAWGRVRAIFNWVWGLIRGTFNTIKGWISAAWNWVANKLANAWNWAWGRIRAIFNWAWGLIRNTFNTIKGWLGAAWNYIANTAVRSWNWWWGKLRGILNWAWGLIRGTFNTIKGWITGAFRWIGEKVKGAWDWMWGKVREIFNWAWGKIRGTLDNMKKIIPNAFQFIVNAAAKIWDGLKGLVAKPINWVIGFVGDRLIPMANTALRAVLGKKAPQIPNGGILKYKIAGFADGGVVPGFKAGGILPGYTPGRDVHIAQSPVGPIGLSGGEGILRPEVMRAPGMASFLHTANSKARHGGISGVKSMLGFASGGVFKSSRNGPKEQQSWERMGMPAIPGFDGGGIIPSLVGLGGKLMHGALGVVKWTKDAIVDKGFNMLIEKVLGKMYNNALSWMGGMGPLGQLGGGVMEKIVSTIVNWVVDKTSGGGGSASSVVAAAQKYIGKGDRGGSDNNQNQFNDQWGMPGAPWCANFVSTCIKDAKAEKFYPGYPSAAVAVYHGAMKKAPWNSAQPGDLRTTTVGGSHINIVEKREGSAVHTIGGNQGPKVNRRIDRSGTILRPKGGAPSGAGGSGGGSKGKGLASMAGTGGGGVGGGGRAFFTHFWDAQTASGMKMSADTIASSYIPLGSKLTVGIGNRSTDGEIKDLGPAKFVYQRHPGVAVLDLATPMMKKINPGMNNTFGKFKINKVGTGRTLYGKNLRGYADGGFMSPGELAVVGERGPELARAGGAGMHITPNHALGGETHVHFHGPVYGEKDFQKKVVTAVDEARRKNRMK